MRAAHLQFPGNVAESCEAEHYVGAQERVHVLNIKHAVARPPPSPRREVTHHII